MADRTRAASGGVVGAALAAALLALLAGCVSAEELRQADEDRCAGYGFARGTPPFANCLQQESLARRYGWTSPWGPNYPYPYPPRW
jgi:hypothetical protein